MIKHRKSAGILAAFLAVFLLLSIVCFGYVNDYYHADSTAIAAFSDGKAVSRQMLQEGIAVYAPEEPTAGLIFYPGGKVEYTAYEPLMLACAEKGILCVLLKMPGNLAVLDRNAADGIAEQYPEIEKWYIGGHSLGGSMAASYAAEHTASLDGLILLAAYSTADLTDSALKVLSVYGSEDRVLNAEKYRKYRNNLPEGFTEVVIDGGCHAYFGMYGAQDGDGIPTISNDRQITMTAEMIASILVQ